MRHLMWILAVACGKPADTESPDSDTAVDTDDTDVEVLPPEADFVPPEGAAKMNGTEGPWARRILGATSEDGLTWTKTGEIVSDQADVPSLIRDDKGWLYLYYYGWTVGDFENVPAMAISVDNGQSWIFKYIGFEGFPGRGDVSDPDARFEDGTFRLWGSTRPDDQTYLVTGEGNDGINFEFTSTAFQPEEGNAGVANVYQVGDTWHLLSLASLGFNNDVPAGTTWHATSTDGTTFTSEETTEFRIDDVQYFHGNVIPVEGGFRLYVFTPGGHPMRSLFSTDGENWEIEAGARLTLDENSGLESGYVGDPDVVQLEDGTYFMAYATLIP